MAVRQALDGDGVVEVAGVLAVDGHRGDGAEVGAALDVLGLDHRSEAGGLGDGGVAVRVVDPVLADDHLEVDAGRIDVAEHLDDAPGRAARRRRPAGDRDRHHLAGLRALGLGRLDLDVDQDLLVERDDVAEARGVEDVAADDLCRGTLEHLDDAAFGPGHRRPDRASLRAAAAIGALGDAGHAFEADDDAVALHRLLEVDAGDVDVAADAFDGALGPDEAEALGAHVDASDHEVHPVGQPEVAAAGGDDRAGRDELLEPAAERRPVLARDLEPLGELRQGGGMVDLLADAGQDLVV